jgi:hypothetical protein
MSLYTSWYDLMSRARYLGADDFAGRLKGILDRWGYPDRTCGGKPLYLGEIPQQEAAGSIGTDFPFPESGMVATATVYGLLNATPRWEASLPGFCLALNPLLPSTWDNYSISRVRFGFACVNITVNQTAIVVELPAGITNAGLHLEINGTRYQLTTLGTGVRVFAYGAVAGEKQAMYQAAQAEHASRVASGQTVNALGVPALAAVPANTSVTLLHDLAAWWLDSINLVDATTYSALQAAISEVSAATPGSEPIFPRAKSEYPFVLFERQHAVASRQRGDLRWCLVHYQRALVIKERVDVLEGEGLASTIEMLPAFIVIFLAGVIALGRGRKRGASSR